MQSLASLMSMKQADIGNLDDFEEENEEDEENRVNQEEKAAKITGEMHLICIIKPNHLLNLLQAILCAGPPKTFSLTPFLNVLFCFLLYSVPLY